MTVDALTSCVTRFSSSHGVDCLGPGTLRGNVSTNCTISVSRYDRKYTYLLCVRVSSKQLKNTLDLNDINLCAIFTGIKPSFCLPNLVFPDVTLDMIYIYIYIIWWGSLRLKIFAIINQMISMTFCKTAVTPLCQQWSYCSLRTSHRYIMTWCDLALH